MRLLIGYDGSDGAKAAIDDLSFAGMPENADARVLSVVEGRAAPNGAIPEECPAIAQEGAAKLRSRFPGWNVSADVCVGAPAWEIIARGEADDVDLIVVGSRGFGELKRLIFGSVVHQVVTQAKRPVRVGRASASRQNDRPPLVIVGTDGSPDAKAAIDAVAGRKWPVGTRILVATFETGVHARLSNWAPNTVWGGDPVPLDSRAAEERPAIHLATEAAHFLKYRCLGATVNTLVQPMDPKYGLIDAAEKWENGGADCIFVGATGVRGIERFLLGSVSTTVALSAPCSVEVVHRRLAR
ncbi:MAG: universal stress protein [Planctomycetes bacterium]|nr:universal stress protein [Planctomycetota bacterium]